MANINPKDINSILDMLSKKMKMNPDELKNAVISGDINKITSSMSKENADKFKGLMNNKDIMNSTNINDAINKYLNK